MHRAAAAAISQNFVFDFPTVRELSFALVSLVDLTETSELRNKPAEIEEMIRRYTAALPVYQARIEATPGNNDIVVLLTGSTGNIGSHILASLLRDPRITAVYTLNRPSSTSADRLFTAFRQRCLPVELLSQKKLSPYVGDLTQECFGLPKELFKQVRSRVVSPPSRHSEAAP